MLFLFSFVYENNRISGVVLVVNEYNQILSVNFFSFIGSFHSIGIYPLFKFTVACNAYSGISNPFSIKNLLQASIWPVSPSTKTKTFFTEQLFVLWDSVRKRAPGTSEKSFIDSLNDLIRYYGRVSFPLYSFRKILLDAVQEGSS